VIGRSRLVGALVGALMASTLSVAVPAGVAASTTQPLPACTYADVLTPRAAYTDWDKTLLDPYFMVPSTYVPPDLVYTSNSGITGGGKVRNLAIADLTAMTSAAKAAGKPIAITSAYRSYSTQASLFNSDVTRLGYDAALLHTARAGHSEHQIGLAIDFKSKRTSDTSPDGDWANTKAGRWMKSNAWKYGWVMSYPYGKTAVTCYQYEPWHYRYFGRTVAGQIQASGLTVREWLWQQGYGLPAAVAAGVQVLAPAA
jgi:D-alanyl-D-alanine carboxypeptidase